MKVKIGTRGSALARVQAEEAAALLRAKGYETEIVIVRTRGDEALSAPLSALGRGAFTDVPDRMLAAGEISLAVHSAKDLPVGSERDGFFCLPRADARDALVFLQERGMRRIGTSSPRRAAAAKKLYPSAEVLPVRGNVDTRIKKLYAGEFDALILAAAGLDRLRLAAEPLQISRLAPAECVPAACQGIIAVEGEAGALLHDEITGRAAKIERALQRALGGDCTGGVGCYFDGAVLYAQREGRVRFLPYTGEEAVRRLAEELS